MRLISFLMTLDSFLDGSKDVTRRYWKKAWVKPGDIVMAVEQCQGLGKGGKIKRLGQIRILSIEPEPLDAICLSPYRVEGPEWPKSIAKETYREGLPHCTPEQFVELFCRANHCKPTDSVYRIRFERIGGA